MRARVPGVLTEVATNACRSSAEMPPRAAAREVGVAAGQDDGQLAGHHLVVGGRLAAGDEALDRHVERRAAGRAGQASSAARAAGSRPATSARALALASASRRSRFIGALAMPSPGRRKSRSRASSAEVETWAVLIISNTLATGGIGRRRFWGCAPAQQHLLAAAPAGHDADADLDEAHVGLGVGLDGGAVEQDLAAAAERHAGRRADRREGANLSAVKACWPAAIVSSIAGHMARLAANRTTPMLAPTEKLSASLWITSASSARRRWSPSPGRACG